MIEISRARSYADRGRKYKIIIDDEEIGYINNGETKSLEVEEGNHNIYLKIDWCRSNEINFYATKDETIEFECGSSIKGVKSLFAFVYITFLKDKYLWLKLKDKSKTNC